MDIKITPEKLIEILKAQRNNALDALAANQAALEVVSEQCEHLRAIAGRVGELEAKLAAYEKPAE